MTDLKRARRPIPRRYPWMSHARIAVAICSTGRPDCLRELTPHLAAQTRPPDRVIFALTGPDDIDHDPTAILLPTTQVEILHAPKGLPRQRNAALNTLDGAYDIVVFYDDDFVPSRFALESVAAAFDTHRQVGGITGHVIADGIAGGGGGGGGGPGYDDASATEMVAARDAEWSGSLEGRILRGSLKGLYGCNMAYRATSIEGVRFDERLPLYAWQEDIDFAARIMGERIQTDAFAGVHRGAKRGRETSGVRLGYSQVANPWYLWRKGTMSLRFGFRLALRNMVANHAKALRPEPWVDRTGRMRGNWLAIRDLLRGRADPERILEL